MRAYCVNFSCFGCFIELPFPICAIPWQYMNAIFNLFVYTHQVVQMKVCKSSYFLMCVWALHDMLPMPKIEWSRLAKVDSKLPAPNGVFPLWIFLLQAIKCDPIPHGPSPKLDQVSFGHFTKSHAHYLKCMNSYKCDICDEHHPHELMEN